jgi:hypothetical protein
MASRPHRACQYSIGACMWEAAVAFSCPSETGKRLALRRCVLSELAAIQSSRAGCFGRRRTGSLVRDGRVIGDCWYWTEENLL